MTAHLVCSTSTITATRMRLLEMTYLTRSIGD